jgi:hypothetical protein
MSYDGIHAVLAESTMNGISSVPWRIVRGRFFHVIPVANERSTWDDLR